MATIGSSSVLEIENCARPSPWTVIVLPVQRPWSRFPEITSQYWPAGKPVWSDWSSWLSSLLITRKAKDRMDREETKDFRENVYLYCHVRRQPDCYRYPTNFEQVEIEQYYGNEPCCRFHANDVHRSIHHRRRDHYLNEETTEMTFSAYSINLRIDDYIVGITAGIRRWTLSVITRIEIVTWHENRVS